jgi:hypothetical protein
MEHCIHSCSSIYISFHHRYHSATVIKRYPCAALKHDRQVKQRNPRRKLSLDNYQSTNAKVAHSHFFTSSKTSS